MYTAKNLEQFNQIISKLAADIHPGDVVGLVGELGAGKTTFVKELAKILGVKEIVASPTYTIFKLYDLDDGNILLHADIYRLKDSKDLESTGLMDYVGQPNVISIIEWADKIKEALPENTKWISINVTDDIRTVEA